MSGFLTNRSEFRRLPRERVAGLGTCSKCDDHNKPCICRERCPCEGHHLHEALAQLTEREQQLVTRIERLEEALRRIYRDRRESDKVLAEILTVMPELTQTAREERHAT